MAIDFHRGVQGAPEPPVPCVVDWRIRGRKKNALQAWSFVFIPRKDAMRERCIDLGDYDASIEGIILLTDTGVLYSNQTGGVCCHHPVARGAFIPLSVPVEIQRMTVDCTYFDDALCDRIDTYLEMLNMRVARNEENEEAWLHVTIAGADFPGILTWENSD